MDVTLLAEDAYLHVAQVVLLALLELRVVPLHLELLGLEVVTRIVLVADGERYDVQVFESLYDGAISAHRHHLQHRLLRAVVGVLGSSLALRNPYVVVLVVDDMVHIAAHLLAALQQRARTHASLHGKSLV